MADKFCVHFGLLYRHMTVLLVYLSYTHHDHSPSSSHTDVIKSSLPRAPLMVRRFPGFAQGYAAGKRTETKFLPSRVCQQFLNRNFDELCKLVLKYRTNKNALVHQTLLQLLPRIAALNQELFALKYVCLSVFCSRHLMYMY